MGGGMDMTADERLLMRARKILNRYMYVVNDLFNIVDRQGYGEWRSNSELLIVKVLFHGNKYKSY